MYKAWVQFSALTKKEEKKNVTIKITARHSGVITFIPHSNIILPTVFPHFPLPFKGRSL
jgi:hypothetical protein